MSYDPEEGKKINELQKKEADQFQREFRELLANKMSRKVFYDIMAESYIFSTTFTKSSQGFFNEGKREVALKLFNAILDLDPNIFAQMCFEFRNKEK